MATKEELFEEATTLFGRQQYEAAIEMYERALQADPLYTDALHGKAMSHFHAGQLERAIETARRILEIDPKDVMASTSLSIFYQRLGKIPEAEHHGSQAKIKGWEAELRERSRREPPPAAKDPTSPSG